MRLDLTLFAAGLCSVAANNTISGLNLQPAATTTTANAATASNPLSLLSALAPQLNALAPQLTALTSLLSAGQTLPSIADLLSLSSAILPSAASTQSTENKQLQQVTSSPSTASTTASAVNPLAALQNPQELLSSLGQLSQAANGLSSITSLLGGSTGMDPSTLLASLGNPTAMLSTLSDPTSMLSSISNPASLLSSLGTSNPALTSLTNPGAMLTSLGNPTSLLQSMFNQSTAATTLGNALGTGSGTPATVDAIANAFVTNGYLNVAGQNAIKLSGMATEAYNYPDLTAALNGQAPVTDSNGKLTLAVQQGLRQLGIAATTPSELVSNVMGSVFASKRRLTAETNLAEALQHFYDALKEAGHEMTNEKAQKRRLQSMYPPVQNPSGRMGGLPGMMSGGSNMMMGNPNMMPGGSNMMMGNPNMMPGGSNMMMRNPSMMPGGSNMMMGNPSMMPGSPGMMPGASNMMMGSPPMSSGGPNMMMGNPSMAYNMGRSMPQGTVPYNSMAGRGSGLATSSSGGNNMMGGRGMPPTRQDGDRSFNSFGGMVNTDFLSVPPIIVEPGHRANRINREQPRGFNAVEDSFNQFGMGGRSGMGGNSMERGGRNDYANRGSNNGARMGGAMSRGFNDVGDSGVMFDAMPNGMMNSPMMNGPGSSMYGNNNNGPMMNDRNNMMNGPNSMMGGQTNVMSGNYGRAFGTGRDDRYRRDNDRDRDARYQVDRERDRDRDRDRSRFQSVDQGRSGAAQTDKNDALLSVDKASSLEEYAVREGAKAEAKRRLSGKAESKGVNLVTRMKRALSAVRGTLESPTVAMSQEDFSQLVKGMSPAHLWMALDHASGHRQLSSWIDSALEKVQSSVASTSPDWRDHVQSAADELASALEGMAGKLKEGDLPSKIQSWWNDFTKEVQHVEEAKGKKSGNGRVMDMTRRRLQESYMSRQMPSSAMGSFASPVDPAAMMATPYGTPANNFFPNDPIYNSYMTPQNGAQMGGAYVMQQMGDPQMMQPSSGQAGDGYAMQQSGSPMDLFGSIGNSFGTITQPFLGGVASLTQPFMESLSMATNSRESTPGALNTGLLQNGLSALGLRRRLDGVEESPVMSGGHYVATPYTQSPAAGTAQGSGTSVLSSPLSGAGAAGLDLSSLANSAGLSGLDLSNLGSVGGMDLSALASAAGLGSMDLSTLGNLGGLDMSSLANAGSVGGLNLSNLSNMAGMLGGLNMSALTSGASLAGIGGASSLTNMTSQLMSGSGLPDLSNLLGNLPSIDMSALNSLANLGSLDMSSLTNLANLGSLDFSNLSGLAQILPSHTGLAGFNLSALTSGVDPSSLTGIVSLPVHTGNVTTVSSVGTTDGSDLNSLVASASHIDTQSAGSPSLLPSSLHDVASAGQTASAQATAPGTAASNPLNNLMQLSQAFPDLSNLLGGASAGATPDLSALSSSMSGLLGGASTGATPDLSALTNSMTGLLGGATSGTATPDLSALANSMSGLLGGASLSNLGLSPEMLSSLSSLTQGLAARRRLQAVDAHVRKLQDIASLTSQLNSALQGLPTASSLGGLNVGNLGSRPTLGTNNALGGLNLNQLPSLGNTNALGGLNLNQLPSLGNTNALGGLNLNQLGTLGGTGGLNLGQLSTLGNNALTGLSLLQSLGNLNQLGLLSAGNATVVSELQNATEETSKSAGFQAASGDAPLMSMQDFLQDVNKPNVALNSMGDNVAGLNLNELASQVGSSNLNVTLLIQRLANSNLDINALVAQGRKGQLTPDTLIAALTNSDIDLNSLAEQISSSGIDLNNLVAGINKGGLSIDDFFNSLTASGVDWNSLIRQIDGSGLDLNQMLQQLAASGIDLSFMAKSGILPTIINSGVISNSGLANILTSMNDGKSVSPIALAAATNEATQSLQAELNATQSSLNGAVQKRLLQAAGAPHKSSFALLNPPHPPRRRLWSLLDGSDEASSISENVYAAEETGEKTKTPSTSRDVDIKYIQEVAFSPADSSFVAVSEKLNMTWSLSGDAPIVAPILACWEVAHMANSDNDWPRFVVEAVSLDLSVNNEMLNSIDLLYPESENLFQYYTPEWNKSHIVQRKQNASCTWVPMCVLHEALNRVQQSTQSNSPITASIVIRANEVPATNELKPPTAKILLRAVGAAGEWTPIVDGDSASSSALLLKPIAEIEKTFEEAPVFSFELPKPTAAQIGSTSAMTGYAVVASATATGLDFVFTADDWQWIPERARPAYGRILEQLKSFEEEEEAEEAGRSEDQEDEYTASSLSDFNPKRDLPLRVPEFTFLPRIVLEATSRSAVDGHQTVIQRCLPMAATTQTSMLGAGLADPLSATVMEMLYASAGAAQTSMRMKSYLEAVPMQALVASQEGFRTLDLRGSLIDDFNKIKWEAGVRLSPINSNVLGAMGTECEGVTCNLY